MRGGTDAGTRRVDVAFGRRLRELRVEAGLTREELASGVGLSPEAVLEHETGRRRMKPNEIVRYTRFFGVRLSAFVPQRPADHGARKAQRVRRHAAKHPSDAAALTRRTGTPPCSGCRG